MGVTREARVLETSLYGDVKALTASTFIFDFIQFSSIQSNSIQFNLVQKQFIDLKGKLIVFLTFNRVFL